MRDLVEYMAKALVDEPDAVKVEEIHARGSTILELHVGETDMGRVIGKQGRIAQSMRALVKVAAARRNERVTLEIV